MVVPPSLIANRYSRPLYVLVYFNERVIGRLVPKVATTGGHKCKDNTTSIISQYARVRFIGHKSNKADTGSLNRTEI